MDSVATLGGWKGACAIFLLCAVTAIASPAQTFKTLVNFDDSNGAYPDVALVQATNGSFYGTTGEGGYISFPECGHGCGTVFKITPSGKLKTLYQFCCNTGSFTHAFLFQAANGDFYGTTAPPEDEGDGTVFKITPSGTLTTLYTFCSRSGCSDGSEPYGALVQVANRDFYGTTSQGGASSNCGFYGCGTVFKITPTGTLTTLYTFCLQSSCPDGFAPDGALIHATNGNFYGITAEGGSGHCVSYCGTVFKMTSDGTLTTLYSFCSQVGCPDGSGPAGLVQATDGNFYGTTTYGGANNCTYGCGTIFKITPAGALTTLYTFCTQSGCPDGNWPLGGLMQATDGNFYGTTSGGGAYNYGTVFQMTPSRTLTTLYSFCAEGSPCPDGANPVAGLVQGTDGSFYGTASAGGSKLYDGTVFSLSLGLGPFVETQPTSGKMRAAVKILGTDLRGATGVTFNGTAAEFKVVSRSLITTTVPTGATTGKVKVTTPRRKLSSNVAFHVTK